MEVLPVRVHPSLTKPVIIFDGDDTLWHTQPLYERAKDKFFDLMASQGFSKEIAAGLLAEIDTKNVSKLGFSRERFPKSLREVYECFCRNNGTRPNSKILQRIDQIGKSVFYAKAIRIRGVRALLQRLRKRYRIYLLTSGDFEIQQRRIDDSGLGDLFIEIFIVDKKNEIMLDQLVETLKIDKRCVWMIGNSIKSDINPALAVGLRCIWIHAGGWEYDIEEIRLGKLWVAEHLTDIVKILEDVNFICHQHP